MRQIGSTPLRSIPLLVVVLAVVAWPLEACTPIGVRELGSRELIIEVVNGSPLAAELAVDASLGGERGGSVRPDVVPAGVTQQVAFTVPPGQAWVIVGPAPRRSPVVFGDDIPLGVSGELSVTIVVGPDGDVSISSGEAPAGWFGQ